MAILDQVGPDVDSESDLLRLNNWIIMALMTFRSEDAQGEPLVCSSAIAGALFGAMHCLAWHFIFPSHVEQIMWRAASVTVFGSCLGVFLAVLASAASNGLDVGSGVVDVVFSVLMSFIFFLTFCSSTVSVVFYPIARVCLLILALTSLRSLPPSAFETVHWIELMPHM